MFCPHITSIIQCFGKIRRELEAFLEILLRLGIIGFALVSSSQVKIEMLVQPFRLGSLRNHFRRRVMLDRFGISLLLAIGDPAQIFQSESSREFSSGLL